MLTSFSIRSLINFSSKIFSILIFGSPIGIDGSLDEKSAWLDIENITMQLIIIIIANI